MSYLWAFLVGGLLCVIGQILIDLTSLTPARILVTYVVSGVVLSPLGLYGPLVELAGAGATVPLTGFGHLLAQGVINVGMEPDGAAGHSGRGLYGGRSRGNCQPDLRCGGRGAGPSPRPRTDDCAKKSRFFAPE